MLSALCSSAILPTFAEGLQTREVSFPSQGQTLVGRVFFPRDYKPSQKRPAVVVTGAWFTIKEQMPSSYAREFAEQGWIALAFDFRGFGKSQGSPRNVENPQAKAEDIEAAAKFLAAQPYTAKGQVAGMSLCASTGYMANAILSGAPIKAFAAAALWIQDQEAVELVYGGKEGVASLLKVGDEAQEAFVKSGVHREVPAAGPPGSDAVMQQAPYYTSPERGMIPEWDNRFALSSWSKWLRFDSLAPARRLRVPTLVLHSDQAALPQWARKFHAALRGPKAIYWSQEAHMDFYDDPRAVSRSVSLASSHFHSHLRGLSVREQVEHVVRQVAASVDAKSWEALKGYFADSLQVDYSSLGGRKGEVASDTLVKEWQEFHDRYPALRHTYTNFATRIEGGLAQVKHDGVAWLQRQVEGKPSTWAVAGEYEQTLRKEKGTWKITGATFRASWTLGSP